MSTPFDLIATPLDPGATLIEASAGTGKTYTISRIFIRLVLLGLAPCEILVTTFTIPATAELRHRIRSAIRDALAACEGRVEKPDDFSRHVATLPDAPEKLRAALRDFDEAAICTMHSFCHRALREHAFECGQLFEIELTTDDKPLRTELAQDWWRREFYEAPPLVVALAALAKLSHEGLPKLIEETSKHPTAAIYPNPAPDAATCRDTALAVFDELRAGWPRWRDAVREIFAETSWANGGWLEKQEPLANLELVEQALASEMPPPHALSALAVFTQANVDAGTNKRKKSPAWQRHPFFDACDRFAAATESLALAWRMDFLRWAPAEAARRKTERNVASFDDLLTRLHAALENPALAESLRSRFSAALIDEFQDTDPTQEAIFFRLFGGAEQRLFLIGDPKQAIYGFRGADVFAYLTAAKKVPASRRFDLRTNYRSTAAAVSAVNRIFNRRADVFIEEGIGFTDASASESRLEGRLTIDGREPAAMEFWHWQTGDKPKVGDAAALFTAAIAAEIASLLGGRAHIGERAVRPDDFAVLTHSNDEARDMQAALAARGIPAVLFSSAPVFQTAEARELLDLLRAAAEPTSGTALRVALATDLLGHTAAEIDALGADEAAWEKVAARFQRYHAVWLERGCIPMLRELIRGESLRARLLAAPGGARRLTNLLHLGELLGEQSHAGAPTPAALVRWFSQRIADTDAKAEEYEQRIESDAEAVRVMTMHKCKGLEFNIVFCPSLWRRAELRPGETTRCHEGGRLAIDFGSAAQEARKESASAERLAEQVRLAYVALTRARHRCVVPWARVNQHDVSAMMWLLHPPGGEPSPEVLKAHAKELDDAAVAADLAALAENAGGAIAVSPLPEVIASGWQPEKTARVVELPRVFHGEIRRDWRVSSFSSLVAGIEFEAADRDGAKAMDAGGEASAGIHAFARGRLAGSCLHEIFERLDFTREGDIEPLATRALEAFGFDARQWLAPVAEMVRRTLALEIAPGFRLRDVPPRRRLAEVEFTLPVARIDAESLLTALGPEAAHGLHFEPRRGLLRGFIDAVVEHEGRFFILDWKSNWLGANTAAYTREAMAAEMARHHYGLQYSLYAVALQRQLAVRGGGRLGGAAYVFLRGPEVFFDALDGSEIARLDALFTTTP